MAQMFVSRPIHREVIKKNLHKSKYIFSKNNCNRLLEGGGCRLQAKHHYFGDEHALVRDKCNFLLVIRVHVYLVVSAKAIQETVHVMARNRV